MTIDDVLGVLRSIQDPATGKDMLRMDYIRDLAVTADEISLTVVVKDPTSVFADVAVPETQKALGQAFPNANINIDSDSAMIGLDSFDASSSQGEVDVDATNIIAVASGKGGVGKSTVSVNLAVALAESGFTVGLVDTDVYGPSIPTMFGLEGSRPRVNESRKLVPLEKFGVHVLSMGFLVDPDKAVVWRGPMIARAVRQFLADTAWVGLDYLLLDLPPGTGDIPLTITQSVTVSGSVIVSTPQPVALADARRGVAMFQQVNVPIMGIVENMSFFSPPDDPQKRYYIFGRKGAKTLASELDVPFLGEIPIEQHVREGGDDGVPIVISHPDSASAAGFMAIAQELDRQAVYRNATRSSSDGVSISIR